MNPQETQQVVARDEKWVPSTERFKISSTNVRLETTVPQKEETFQYTIKKIKDSESYEFLLANKKCIVDPEVLRKILDICPRVEGEEFTPVQDDDDTLTFLTDLRYKGPLYKHTNMFVDHMHQPWRTLEAIINKCLSGKTTSNDKLRKSKFDILWGMFYKENVDYPKLKFVRIGEDCQEYGLAIPDVMLNDIIIQSESYQMFLKYSTGQIPPKKSKGKGLQGKKTIDVSQETVDVSEDSEPEPAKKKNGYTTKAEEEEAARQVHATHARIVTESVPEPAKKKISNRSTRSVVIQDTPSAPKSKPAALKPNLKGVQSLTPEEQEAADAMQALKESKKISSRQPGTRGSSEGTGRIPGIPDESTIVSATSSEGTGTKPRVPDEEEVSSEEKVILEWGSKQESKYSNEDLSGEEEIDWIDSEEDDEKKDDSDDDKSFTPRQGGNTRRNIMDIITTQWCQQ
ncbi:hypothetical protein Tco_0985139 [Tanacetum coccineum]